MLHALYVMFIAGDVVGAVFVGLAVCVLILILCGTFDSDDDWGR